LLLPLSGERENVFVCIKEFDLLNQQGELIGVLGSVCGEQELAISLIDSIPLILVLD